MSPDRPHHLPRRARPATSRTPRGGRPRRRTRNKVEGQSAWPSRKATFHQLIQIVAQPCLPQAGICFLPNRGDRGFSAQRRMDLALQCGQIEGWREREKVPAPSPGCRVLSPFSRHSPAILCAVPPRNCLLLHNSANFVHPSAQPAPPLHAGLHSNSRTPPASSPPLRHESEANWECVLI